METVIHHIKNQDIAEIKGDGVFIKTVQDALDLMADHGYRGITKMILHQKNITPEFFNLKSRLAGEILQKFVLYQMQVAIIGNFQNVASESLKAFILESNRGRQNFFANSVAEAQEFLTR